MLIKENVTLFENRLFRVQGRRIDLIFHTFLELATLVQDLELTANTILYNNGKTEKKFKYINEARNPTFRSG